MDLLLLAYEDGKISLGEAFNVSLTGMIVVLLVLALLAVLVLVLSKSIRAVTGNGDTKKSAEPANTSPAPIATAPVVATAPQVELENVDNKTAAVIMAIVSDESGIPLNRLQFVSIKGIEK